MSELKELRDRIDSLFDAIKHGDETHQNWLRGQIYVHFYGGLICPMPEPGQSATLTFEQIEELLPETKQNADGSLAVSAQDLHRFARDIYALKTRQAIAPDYPEEIWIYERGGLREYRFNRVPEKDLYPNWTEYRAFRPLQYENDLPAAGQSEPAEQQGPVAEHVATIHRPYDNSGFNVEWLKAKMPDGTKLYTQPQRPAVPDVNDGQIKEWADRWGIERGISNNDLRCCFEDAQSLHLLAAAPQQDQSQPEYPRVQIPRDDCVFKGGCVFNVTGCPGECKGKKDQSHE